MFKATKGQQLRYAGITVCSTSYSADYHEHTCKTNNSYISQMEQHLPFRLMLLQVYTAVRLGNVPYLLDVTPSNPLPHLFSPPPIPLHVIQVQTKQHATRISAYL